MQTPDWVVLIVVLLPFLGAVLAPILQRLLGGTSGWVLALIPAAGVAALWGLAGDMASGHSLAVSFAWAPSWGLNLSFLIDGLSFTFALTIAVIGALVVLYSGAYLRGHPHQGRFMGFLLGFMGAMQGLVLADSLVALYLFWELTSVASFLLIGFDHSRPAARRAAIQALVVTGAGGLALLAAGVTIHSITGSWELSAATGLKESLAYPLLVGLMLAAAFTKSAQVPFHFWLPNAMEAPTPVSAYLHSATMVQGGVYLVARLSPHLGGAPIWNTTLMLFGGVTLLWGAIGALRQTDLKLMLAQTTLASLGLLMLLLGAGSELAVTAAVLYFVAHALYKAGLFLVVGAIDHGTGTRDYTALGGLRDPMALTFIGTIMAAAGMLGLPPLVAFFAKEEMYAAVASGELGALVALAALVIGNVLLGVVALVVLIRPFMGELLRTPIAPHEAGPAMLAGPIVTGMLGIGLGFLPVLGDVLVGPAVAAISGHAAELHLDFRFDAMALPLWLSIATWALAVGLYFRFDDIRLGLRRLANRPGWSFDNGIRRRLFRAGSARGAGDPCAAAWPAGALPARRLPRAGPRGGGAAAGPGGLPGLGGSFDLTFYEAGTVAITVIGVITVLLARTRLFAILALGVQGLGVSMLYLLFGAPDVSFTQFMVEILSVVILTLVMTRLRLDASDPRPLEDWMRDGVVALFAGTAITMLLLAVLEGVLDPKLGEFFAAQSVPSAHGHNVVNVILVDFRGLDTLGEISVVMTAGIAILALIRSGRRRPQAAPAKARTRRRPEGGGMNTLIFRTLAPILTVVMLCLLDFRRAARPQRAGRRLHRRADRRRGDRDLRHGLGTGGGAQGAAGASARALRVRRGAGGALRPAVAAVEAAIPDRALGASVPIGRRRPMFDIGVYFVVFGTLAAVTLGLEDEGRA